MVLRRGMTVRVGFMLGYVERMRGPHVLVRYPTGDRQWYLARQGLALVWGSSPNLLVCPAQTNQPTHSRWAH